MPRQVKLQNGKKLFSMFAALFFLIGILGVYPIQIPLEGETESVFIQSEIQTKLQAVDILSKIADFISAADSGVIHSIVQDMVRQTSLLLFAAVWMIYFLFRSMEQIWGPYASLNNKSLCVNMTNIRRKRKDNPADPKYIFTEPGVGCRMAESESSE